jgi:hypothetical protein
LSRWLVSAPLASTYGLNQPSVKSARTADSWFVARSLV